MIREYASKRPFKSAAFGILFLLGGCEATRPSVKPSFWHQRKSIIGVGYLAPAHSDCHVGTSSWGQCLITVMLMPGWEKINRATVKKSYEEQYGGFDQFIDGIDRVTPLVELQHAFVQRLGDLGYSVKEINYPVEGRLVDDANTWDYTDLAVREQVDTLLMIGDSQIGAADGRYKDDRWFMTYCFGGFMNKMQHGKMRKNTFRAGLWKWGTPDEVCYIPAGKDWNEASHFESDKKLLGQALRKSQEYLLDSFFKTLPPK